MLTQTAASSAGMPFGGCARPWPGVSGATIVNCEPDLRPRCITMAAPHVDWRGPAYNWYPHAGKNLCVGFKQTKYFSLFMQGAPRPSAPHPKIDRPPPRENPRGFRVLEVEYYETTMF